MSELQSVYDEQRGTWVKAQPEEIIRQKVVRFLIQKLGFPASLVLVEKKLNQLPHLHKSSKTIPNRRLDIVCYGRNPKTHHELVPLLLIECKAVPLTEQVVNQVVGYNHYVGAPYVTVVNENEAKSGTFCPNTQAFRFTEGIPSYEYLINI